MCHTVVVVVEAHKVGGLLHLIAGVAQTETQINL